MKNGIPTRLKSILPFVKYTLDGTRNISTKARMRLKWMHYIDQGNSVPKCSRHFDIPERTIRYWRKRYNKNNPLSLEDCSKRPTNVRRSLVSQEHINLVIQIRSKPGRTWDKVKIQRELKKRGIQIGQSRIQSIINQAGLKRKLKVKNKTKRKNRQHMYSVPFEIKLLAGGLIYIDVKHLVLTGGGKAYQFTAIDHATRKGYAYTYSGITSGCAANFLERVRKYFGFKIQYVGTDNGSEFAALFEEAVLRIKAIHVYSSPRSPKQNPFVERFIRTIIEEHYRYFGVGISCAENQKSLERYLGSYNILRPHAGIDYDTPVERYVKITNSLV